MPPPIQADQVNKPGSSCSRMGHMMSNVDIGRTLNSPCHCIEAASRQTYRGPHLFSPRPSRRLISFHSSIPLGASMLPNLHLDVIPPAGRGRISPGYGRWQNRHRVLCSGFRTRTTALWLSNVLVCSLASIATEAAIATVRKSFLTIAVCVYPVSLSLFPKSTTHA